MSPPLTAKDIISTSLNKWSNYMADHMFDNIVKRYNIQTGSMSDISNCRHPLRIEDFNDIDVLYIPLEFKVLKYKDIERIADGHSSVPMPVHSGYILIFEDRYNDSIYAFHTHYIGSGNGRLNDVNDIDQLLRISESTIWTNSPDLVLAKPLFEK